MESITKTKQLKEESLFIIALIPDRALREKINLIKKDFSKRFGSSKALKVYPHITLKNPFICSDGGKRELINWFFEMGIQQKPFAVQLKGFGAFQNKNSPVVFINPLMNSELSKMQRELMIGFGSLFPAYVHPVDVNFKQHITVAYRDLTPENFSRAWKEYKDKIFNDVFNVHSVYLLQHDKIKWNIINTYKLG